MYYNFDMLLLPDFENNRNVTFIINRNYIFIVYHIFITIRLLLDNTCTNTKRISPVIHGGLTMLGCNLLVLRLQIPEDPRAIQMLI